MQRLLNLGFKPLVAAGFLFGGLELGNDGRQNCGHESDGSTTRSNFQVGDASLVDGFNVLLTGH